MAEAVRKDLRYFLAHPDEMPEDPKELERLANEEISRTHEAGTEQVKVDTFAGIDETAVPSTAGKEEEPKEEAKAEPEAKEEPAEEPKEAKPEGVLAKDGKNFIPYSVLEAARKRAEQATQLVTEQAAEIERLKAEKSAPPEKAEPSAGMLTEDELAALETESPTLAKVLRSQQNTIVTLTKKVAAVEGYAQGEIAQQETEIKYEIQQAIDGNPTLASWQAAEDQTMWEKASGVDRLLRSLPEYKDVPFEKRFEKVVKLTQDALNLEAPKVEPKETKPSSQAVRAAAEAKLRNIRTTPTTLSDIPGGAPPVVDEREKVEHMSSVALGNMFLGMTPEQREAYLASL